MIRNQDDKTNKKLHYNDKETRWWHQQEADRLSRGKVVRLTLGFRDGAIELTAIQA